MFDHIRNFEGFIVQRNQILLESDRDMTMDEKIIKARIKVNKALLWVNINRGFFGRLLGNLNIYGSSAIDPPTMCTNGLNIVYHPDFVLTQTDAAIRFVLCHEVLHCVGDHMTRRGNRDPLLWNYAADYAINPILNDEIDRDFAWPIVPETGERMGLFEQKYSGMRAEDIYDVLAKDMEVNLAKAKEWEKKKKDFGRVIDGTEDLPEPDDDESIVQDLDPDGQDKDPKDFDKDPKDLGDPIPPDGDPIPPDGPDIDDPVPPGGTGDTPPDGPPGDGPPRPGDGPPGDGPPRPGDGPPGDGPPRPGDGPPRPADDDDSDKPDRSKLIGKKVTITSGPNKGKTGIIKRVLPNGDIEIQ